MRKKKETRRRHYFIVTVAKLILMPVIKIMYKLKYKFNRKLKKQQPLLILGNHTIPLDPLLMGAFFPFHIHYFASEQIFNLGLLSKLLVYAVNPIQKKKSMNDIAAIRKARNIVNEGKSIGVYPEGNVTYAGETNKFDKSIVKLVRLLKIPVALFITEGLYLSNPRWAVYKKRGKSKLYIREIIEKEEYDNLTDDELYERIYNGLYVSAYDKDPNILYKGKKIAKGLERLIFMDLNTNEPLQTYTKNNKLLSHVSDFELTYLPTAYLKDNKGKEYTLIELNNKVKESYFNYYKNSDQFSFDMEIINLEKTEGSRKQRLGKGNIVLNKDKIIVKQKNKDDLVMLFEDCSAIAIQGKRKIIVYHNNDTWLMTFNDYDSPYIYLLTYEFYKLGDDIHDFRGSISDFGL